MQQSQLAHDWIKSQRENQHNHPAVAAVILLSIYDPEALWLLILEMLSVKNIDDVIGMIGAGPLEDLISENGESFIERIKTQLDGNPILARAMESVWVSEDVKPSVQSFTELGCQFVSAKPS